MQDTAYVPKPKTGYSPNACTIPLPQFGCKSFHSPTAATARSRSSGSGIPVASRSLLLNEFQDLHLLQKLRQAPRTGSPPHGEQKVTVPEAPGHGLRTCGRKHPVDERSPEVKADSHQSKFMNVDFGGGKNLELLGDIYYFCGRLVPKRLFPSRGIKREPGEIPGQTRCCEAPPIIRAICTTGRFVPGRSSDEESVRRPANDLWI